MGQRGRPKKEVHKDVQSIRIEDELWEMYLEACRKTGRSPTEKIRIMIKETIEKSKLKR